MPSTRVVRELQQQYRRDRYGCFGPSTTYSEPEIRNKQCQQLSQAFYTQLPTNPQVGPALTALGGLSSAPRCSYSMRLATPNSPSKGSPRWPKPERPRSTDGGPTKLAWSAKRSWKRRTRNFLSR